MGINVDYEIVKVPVIRSQAIVFPKKYLNKIVKVVPMSEKEYFEKQKIKIEIEKGTLVQEIELAKMKKELYKLRNERYRK